jgi:hypothetical protein
MDLQLALAGSIPSGTPLGGVRRSEIFGMFFPFFAEPINDSAIRRTDTTNHTGSLGAGFDLPVSRCTLQKLPMCRSVSATSDATQDAFVAQIADFD